MYNEDDYDAFAEKMEKAYPKMFAEPYGGFAVGAGWWPIIETLCRQIQHHIDWQNEQAIKYQRGQPVAQVVVRQIKEKFGGLRFYYDGGDDEVSGMVSMAESWASRSCEECGNVGTSRNSGWIKTLCDAHEEERQQRMKERFDNDNN